MATPSMAPDPERTVRDVLASLIAPREPAVTVAVGVPDTWTPASPPHLQVAWDGGTNQDRPAIVNATIRVVAWAADTTTAKRLAMLAEALLIAHPGGDGVASISPLIPVLPTRDTSTGAQLASVSVRARLRVTPI